MGCNLCLDDGDGMPALVVSSGDESIRDGDEGIRDGDEGDSSDESDGEFTVWFGDLIQMRMIQLAQARAALSTAALARSAP